jgi:integrase
MASWFAGDTTKVNKHAIVGKRQIASGESDEFHARIWMSTSRKYKYISLGTRSLTQAVEVALREQARFQLREEEGLAVFRTSVSSKLDDFESEYEVRSVSDKRKILVQNQTARFREYFANRNVSSIHKSELKDYIEWRKKNNRKGTHHGISNAVLHSEAILLSSFIGYLANNGEISERLFRSIRSSGWSNYIGKKETRGSLTVEQYKSLRDYTSEWHLEERVDERAKYTRQVVHRLIRIAGHTGLRTIELKNLRWGDITKHEVGVVLSVKGKSYAKRERFRKILTDADTYEYLMEVKALVQSHGLGVSDQDYIFVKYNGRQAYDLWAQNIRIAFQRLDMKKDNNGRNLSLYSLRHYFANRQIEGGKSIYDLAEYMGTSVKMIEQYYGKGTHESLGMRVMGELIDEVVERNKDFAELISLVKELQDETPI